MIVVHAPATGLEQINFLATNSAFAVLLREQSLEGRELNAVKALNIVLPKPYAAFFSLLWIKGFKPLARIRRSARFAIAALGKFIWALAPSALRAALPILCNSRLNRQTAVQQSLFTAIQSGPPIREISSSGARNVPDYAGPKWELFLVLNNASRGGQVFFYREFLPYNVFGIWTPHATLDTKEPLHICSTRDVGELKVVPNLKWIVPFCLDDEANKPIVV